MRSEQRQAIFAKLRARTSNVGRQVPTLYKNKRELSESQYRARKRNQRGIAIGAGIGAGIGGGRAWTKLGAFDRGLVRRSARAIGHDAVELLKYSRYVPTILRGIIPIPKLKSPEIVGRAFESPGVRKFGKKTAIAGAIGAALGTGVAAFSNPEYVVKKRVKRLTPEGKRYRSVYS